MKYKASEIRLLMDAVARKAGTTFHHASMKKIYSELDNSLDKLILKEDYLYKQIYDQLKKLKGKNAMIGLNKRMVDQFLDYLSFYDMPEFIKALSQPEQPVLKNYEGKWYSYVRCNSGEEYVLISPVHIYSIDREMLVELRGPRRIFHGKLKRTGNCISCMMESEGDKALHLVFQVGNAQEPDVLQGVFSGMSAAGDPIAGREILIRAKSNEKFQAMENLRRPISAMIESKNEEEKAVGMYFKKPEHNILKAGRSSTFTLDDLKIR